MDAGANSLSRLNFTLVLGVDLYVAEAFVRMQLLLSGRGVILVICSAVDGKIQGTGPLDTDKHQQRCRQASSRSKSSLAFTEDVNGRRRLVWTAAKLDFNILLSTLATRQ